MRKRLTKTLAFTLAATLMVTSVDLTGFAPVTYVQAATAGIDVSGAYKFDVTSTWDNNSGKENNIAITTDATPAEGTTLVMDVLLPDNGNSPSFSGVLKAIGVLRVGSDWNWVQSNTIPEMNASDFTETVTIDGENYYMTTVSIPFEDSVGANGASGWNGSMPFADAVNDIVSQVTVQFAGYQNDYEGKIAIANARLINTEGNTGVQSEVVKEWTFDDGIGNWENAGWDYQYNGDAVTTEADNGMLKVNVDYSRDKDYSWSQIGVREWGDVALSGVNKTTFDFYYDSTKLDGGFKIKETIQYDATNGDYPDAVVTDVTVDTDNAEDVGEGIKKVKVELVFDPITQDTCCNTVLCIVGVNTSYAGSIWIDNLRMIKETSTVEEIYVNSTVAVDDKTNAVTIVDNKLQTSTKDGSLEETALASEIKLVDKDATAQTKAIYAYLQAMGKSSSVLYGHQNDTWHKAGAATLSDSDTRDVTGSIAGIIGIDSISLSGDEYSAQRYNSEIGDQTFSLTAEGNVLAAAALTNKNIEEGAIITLSAHMPNFSIVKESKTYEEGVDPSYAKYDFAGYSPNVLTGNVMNQILPGGMYNEKYNAYLDMIADYANHVDGTILFRPFHENTGSWFWWGAAFCDTATYKNVWKYTVEYLRDDKGVHNLLYVYGPGSEASDVEEYGERYPGDNYVDMVGFDIYNDNPKENNADTWFVDFKKALSIVEDFGTAHGKLVAVTETGIRNEVQKGDNQTALLKTGNLHKDWYNTLLEAVSDSEASFFLLWANFGKKDGFYTPYVEEVKDGGVLYGQELLDNFIDYYNDGRSIFAANQKTILSSIASTLNIEASSNTEDITGYLVSPISGTRILEAVSVMAKVNGVSESDTVKVVFKGKATVTINAQLDGKYYSATLSEADLKKLGECVGTIDLYVNNTKLDSFSAIYNIQPPVEDPYEIDGFETYNGVDSLLTSKWATNKATGSKITISLVKDKVYDGDYAMKFAYEETADGWAGATISKEVDWSNCDALQFYTIPDGNNQKVVVQITANGKVYETYMNLYEGYAGKTTPILVTIPFSDFCERDTKDNPKGGLLEDSSKVTSFGLWVNAIDSSPAVVDNKVTGIIYYDKITAVSSGVTKATFKDIKKENNSTTNPSSAEQEEETKEEIKLAEQESLQIIGVGSELTFGKTASLNVTGGSGDGAVTFAVTSGSKYATVDAKTGKVQTTGVGEVTVTATKAGDSKYKEATATISFKVVMPKKNATITIGTNKYKVVSTTSKKEALAYVGTTKKDSKSIVIPATVKVGTVSYKVTSIEKAALKGCKKVTSVTIGKNVTTIGDSAFEGCTALTKITIPENVTTIGKKAFYKDSKLKTITVKSKKLTKIGADAFKGVHAKAKITVPASKLSSYKKLLKGKGQAKTVTIK
ncbi:glycosyl hydrolase [Anaerosporobacter sp.]|uniref:glycosyl hydrolase n=1 Tax=Anaerosporobacter sp. TaxID=1872529 RepID=UPI00286EC77A|nr:glycosyl hydrolase [Anaerosporobacter sp.]